MNGLWADGWFYISSLGLVVSGVLFFAFLAQYRAAADAADSTQAAPEDLEVPPSPVQPVYFKDEPAPAPEVASPLKEVPLASPKAEPVAAERAQAAAAAVAPEPAATARRDSTTSGISPAVVYLQNIKMQLEGLNGQVTELSKRVESVTSRDEALIERLGELARAVEDLKSGSSAPPAAAEQEPPARRSRKAVEKPVVSAPPLELAPPPVEAAPVPQPAPAPEPVMKLERGPAPGAQIVKADVPAPDPTVILSPEEVSPVSEAAPEKSEAPAVVDAEKPLRRGPVWPV